MSTRDINFRLTGEDKLGSATKAAAGHFSALGGALGKVNSAGGSLSGQFAGLGENLLKFGAIAGGAALTGVTALTAGITAMVASSVTKAADLDAQMATIAATMNTTKAAVGPLKDLILDLALDPNLTVTATQAADAIQLLAQNGLSMQQIMDGAAASTVALANATGAEFGTAADVASGVMSVFNIQAKDMEKAIDGITGVTNQSKFTIEDYGQAFAAAGGIAAGMGVDFDDFNAVIASTATSFNSGSDAGTSFKTFLQRLANPTNEMKGLMSELGISLFDNEGNMRDMKDVAGQLHGAFENLTEAQRAEVAAQLGGADASRTVLALAKLSADEFDNLTGSVNDSGQAFRAAATRVDSIKGAFDIFQGIIEALQIQIGDKFLPILRKITVAFAGMATGIGPQVVGFFGKVSDGITSLVNTGVELFKVFQSKGAGGLFAAMGLEGSALFLKKLAELFGMLGGEGATLGETIRSTVGAAFQWLSTSLFPTLSTGVQFVIDHFAEFKGALLGIGAVLAGGIFVALAAAVLSLLSPITLIIAGAALLGAAWAGNWGDIQGKTAAAWAVIQPVLAQLGTWLQTNIPVAVQTLSNAWSAVLLPALTAVWQFISGTLFPLWAELQVLLVDVIGFAVTNLSNQWTNVLLPAVTGVWSFISGSLMPLLASVGNFLTAVVGLAVTALAGLWQNVLQPALEAVGSYISEKLEPIFKTVTDKVENSVSPALSKLSEKVLPPLRRGLEAVKKIIQDVTGFFNGLATAVRNFELPAVLQRHSPSPFEQTLQSIAVLAHKAGDSFGDFQGSLDKILGLKAPIEVSFTHAAARARDDLEKFLDKSMGRGKGKFVMDAFRNNLKANAEFASTATDAQLQDLLMKSVRNWQAAGVVGAERAAEEYIKLIRGSQAQLAGEAEAATASNFQKMLAGVGQFASAATGEADALNKRITILNSLLRQGGDSFNVEGQIVNAAQAQQRLNQYIAEQASLQGDLAGITGFQAGLQNLQEQQALLGLLGAPADAAAGDIVGGLNQLMGFLGQQIMAGLGQQLGIATPGGGAGAGSGGGGGAIGGGTTTIINFEPTINTTENQESILAQFHLLMAMLPSGT